MIVAVLFLLLFLLLLQLKLRVEIRSEGRRIHVILRAWKVPLFCMELLAVFRQGSIPALYWERKKVCLQMFPQMEDTRKPRPKWVRRVFRQAYTAEKLHINAVIGTGDAAETAYAVGVFRILLENIIAAASLHCQDMRICIQPDFSRERLQIQLDCIITAAVADIIRKAIISERRKENASNRKHLKKYNV